MIKPDKTTTDANNKFLKALYEYLAVTQKMGITVEALENFELAPDYPRIRLENGFNAQTINIEVEIMRPRS